MVTDVTTKTDRQARSKETKRPIGARRTRGSRNWALASLGLAMLLAPAAASAAPPFPPFQFQAELARPNSDPVKGPIAVRYDSAVVSTMNADHHHSYYSYTRSAKTWSNPTPLPGVYGDSSNGEWGTSLAFATLDADTLVIGDANGPDAGNAGRALVFVRSGSEWTLQAVLQPSTPQAGEGFGFAVDVARDEVFVGAPFYDGVGEDSGAVYVFSRSGTTWTQTNMLSPQDAQAGQRFGFSIALREIFHVAIGAPAPDSTAAGIYLFYGQDDFLNQELKLQGASGRYGFGRQVAAAPYSVFSSANDGADFFGVDLEDPTYLRYQARLVTAPVSPVPYTIAGGEGEVVTCNPSGACILFENTSEFTPQVLPIDGGGPVSVADHDHTLIVAGPNVNGDDGGAALVYVRAFPPTDVTLSSTSVAENQPAGTVVGTFSVTDADINDTFLIDDLTGGYAGNLSFTVVGNQLVTRTPLNYEAQSAYTINVRVTDSFDRQLSKLMTIHVTDVPETMPDDDVLYFSPAAETTLGGVVVEDEDIVKFVVTTNSYEMFFDGSDVGLSGHGIDAFTMRADGSLLLSFDSDVTLPGVGTVRRQDVVRFIPSSLGETTAGTFQPFFVGRDHGLTATNADVTGVYEARDGRLFLNFGAAVYLPNLNIYTEDIVQFNPETNDYSMIFDGTDVGLGPYSLGAFDFQPDGSLLLSVKPYPTSTGLPPALAAGTKQDAFFFKPSSYPDSYGPRTSGKFQPYYIGSEHGAPSTLQIDALYRGRDPEPAMVYQAEWATLAGGSIVESVNRGYAGYAYVNASVSGGSIEFRDVQGGWGGTHVLRVRNALGVTGSRTGRLLVNGKAQSVTFVSTGSWSHWVDTDIVATLQPGTNTIRFESTGRDLPNIDQLEVVTLAEAENAYLGGGSVAETVNAGYTGSGYVNSSVNGGFTEFRAIDGGYGGTRMLRIRFALGVDASRTGRLVINGVPQTITFPSTGWWTEWTTRDVPVNLAGGAVNTIRFESTGSDLANIDKIEIH